MDASDAKRLVASIDYVIASLAGSPDHNHARAAQALGNARHWLTQPPDVKIVRSVFAPEPHDPSYG